MKVNERKQRKFKGKEELEEKSVKKEEEKRGLEDEIHEKERT